MRATDHPRMPQREGARRQIRSRAAAIAVALAGLLLATSATGGAAGGKEARAVVDTTMTDVLAVLASADLDANAKLERVESIVRANVDFETVARLVLARNWRRFTEQQRADFVREFKTHLSRTYGRSIDDYSNQRVEITSDRAEARGDWTVRTKVLRQSSDAILVDYRLRAKYGPWKIIDIIIEGVSLVANFRSQFQGILANHDPDHLLKLLRDKNLASEPTAGTRIDRAAPPVASADPKLPGATPAG